MTTPPANSPRLLALESLRVQRDRIVASVRVDPAHADTTPAIARAAAAIRPNLPRHACVNDDGPLFASAMERTPLPHLLEHLVIDLQVSACPDAGFTFTGATRWTDRAAGRARVEVSYADDLVGIAAFRDAAALLNSLGSR